MGNRMPQGAYYNIEHHLVKTWFLKNLLLEKLVHTTLCKHECFNVIVKKNVL